MTKSSRAPVRIVDRDHIAIDSHNHATAFESSTDGLDDQPETGVLVFQIFEALVQIGDFALEGIDNVLLHFASSPAHAAFEGVEAPEETSYGQEETENAKSSREICHRLRSFLYDYLKRHSHIF